jgi:hypothetical protein
MTNFKSIFSQVRAFVGAGVCRRKDRRIALETCCCEKWLLQERCIQLRQGKMTSIKLKVVVFPHDYTFRVFSLCSLHRQVAIMFQVQANVLTINQALNTVDIL